MKIKKSKKYVIVPQQFHPNQIGEMSMFCVVIKESKLDELFEFIVNNGGRVVSAIPCHGVSKNSFDKLVDGFVNNEYLVIDNVPSISEQTKVKIKVDDQPRQEQK